MAWGPGIAVRGGRGLAGLGTALLLGLSGAAAQTQEGGHWSPYSGAPTERPRQERPEGRQRGEGGERRPARPRGEPARDDETVQRRRTSQPQGTRDAVAGRGRNSADAEPPPPSEADPRTDAKPVPPPAPPRPPLGGRKALIEFQSSPFPYDGPMPPDDKPFFDVSVDGRRGRLSPRTGNVHWEDEVYADRHVLLYLTRGFTTSRPGMIVLYFHGNGTRLVRDVERRQAVLHQVEAARVNGVVVAPQLAVDAADSTPGNLWRPGHLATFLEEAAVALAKLHGRRRQAGLDPADAFRHSPVVIVAYSGGYLPAAWSLHHGGADERIAGVVILDGMYGEQARFADWLERRRDAFLVSASGPSSAEGNTELRRLLGERELRQVSRLDGRLAKGSVTFVAVPGEVRHADFVTEAWVRDPIADVLRRLPR